MQPQNDYGNGQRLIIHFGEDLMSAPRIGWFTWSGGHWARLRRTGPDHLAHNVPRYPQIPANLLNQRLS